VLFQHHNCARCWLLLLLLLLLLFTKQWSMSCMW